MCALLRYLVTLETTFNDFYSFQQSCLLTFCGFTSVAGYVKAIFVINLFLLAKAKRDFTTISAIA